MIRLGHIEYSNCFPVHALLLERPVPGIELHRGVPSELNRALDAGEIDVAPSSSIEYARHPDRYRIVPGVVIGSDGPVESILLETGGDLEDLDGADVLIPTASATSVVLLRVLLELHVGVRPRYHWFDQSATGDPLVRGPAAALWIGDAALRRETASQRRLIDLGSLWRDWTGLPFAFALWQTTLGADREADLGMLQARLLASLEYFESNLDRLAIRMAAEFGYTPERLARYWRGLRFRLTPDVEQGLLRFYDLAAALGEIPYAPPLRRIATST